MRPEDVKVERDENGLWWHPSINWDEVPEDADAMPLIKASGYETSFVAMADDAPADLLKRWFDAGLPDDINEWQPSRPDGDGWFLGGIYETEGGPEACWLRRASGRV